MKRIFTDCQIVNLKTGERTSGLSLVVENGRFVDITTHPGKGESLSLHGGFVLPGLIDAHVHLVWEGQPDPAHYTLIESPIMTAYRAARSAWQNLAGGVTTVRDVGGPHNIPIEVAKAVKARAFCPAAGFWPLEQALRRQGDTGILCAAKPTDLMRSARRCANRSKPEPI